MGQVVDFIQRNWKWILVVIVIIVVYYAIRRNWYTIKFWFQPRDIDVAPGETTNISSSNEMQLKNLAQRIYTDIYDTPFWGGHNYSVYEEAMALSDSELLFMAKFYRTKLTRGVTLYDDMNNEVYVFTDLDTALKSRLSKIGEGTKGDSRIMAEARALAKRMASNIQQTPTY